MKPDPSKRPQEGDIIVLFPKVQNRQPLLFKRPVKPLEEDLPGVGIKVEIASDSLNEYLAMFGLELAGKITDEVMYVRNQRADAEDAAT